MDFGKYEKYMNDRKAVTVENNRRIEKKFAECEKWVADNLINCGCVFTNHSELLQNPCAGPTLSLCICDKLNCNLL